jgi:hypothetical protein
MDIRLVEWNVDAQEFVDILLDVSQGNFMYLKLILDDIHERRLTRENVGGSVYKLPVGLLAYYEKHWEIVKEEDTELFEKYDSKVIYQIGAAHEPVPIDILQRATDLRHADVTRIIRKWRQFLVRTSDETGAALYRIYHNSFFEFLEKEHSVGLKNAKRNFANDTLAQINWSIL